MPDAAGSLTGHGGAGRSCENRRVPRGHLSPHRIRRYVVGAVALTVLPATAACTSSQDTPDGQPAAAPSSTEAPAPPPVPDAPVWRARADIDTPRDDFADAVVGDRIWAMGGMTGERGTRLTTTEVYDTRTDAWRYGPDVPAGLASFEADAVGSDIYVFGGFDVDFHSSDFAAVLDTRTGTWHNLPPLPHARYAHSVTALGDKLYVIGGDGVDGPVRHIDVFDTATRTWHDGGVLPKARGSHDAVAVGGKIYVLGGWLGNAPTDLVQVYDPRSRTFATAAPLPEPMSRGGAAAVGGRVYASYHEFSAVYDVAADRWSSANPMTFSRHGMGYLPVGNKVYSVGGCAESPLRDVDIVDMLDTTAGQ